MNQIQNSKRPLSTNQIIPYLVVVARRSWSVQNSHRKVCYWVNQFGSALTRGRIIAYLTGQFALLSLILSQYKAFLHLKLGTNRFGTVSKIAHLSAEGNKTTHLTTRWFNLTVILNQLYSYRRIQFLQVYSWVFDMWRIGRCKTPARCIPFRHDKFYENPSIHNCNCYGNTGLHWGYTQLLIELSGRWIWFSFTTNCNVNISVCHIYLDVVYIHWHGGWSTYLIHL